MNIDYTDTQRRKKRRRHECRVCAEPIAHRGPVSLWPSYKLRGFCSNACRMMTVSVKPGRRDAVQNAKAGAIVYLEPYAEAFIRGAYWTPGPAPERAGFL